MKKVIVLTSCLLFLCCCVGSLPLIIPPITPTKKYEKSYELEKTYNTRTGSTMLTVHNAYVYPAYRPKYTYQPPHVVIFPSSGPGKRIEMPPLKPDQKWTVFRQHKGHYFIYLRKYYGRFGIEIKPNGELGHKKAWIGRGGRAIQSPWILPSPPQLFEKAEDSLVKMYGDSFKAELIYTGKMNNIITIRYREYIDSMAREAFYQDLRYDLSEGDEISFKSLEIKVLGATNNQITFQVLDDGGLPWVPRE